jgi:hypothetical protein
MQIAEEGQEATILRAREQHIGAFRFGTRELRSHRIARLVVGLKVFAVEHEMRRVFTGQNGVGLRARRDENRLGR